MKMTGILLSFLLSSSLFAAEYHMPKTPVVGSLDSPTNTLFQITDNQGFAEVDKALHKLEATYGDSLVAIGAREMKGEATIFRTHYYQKSEDGSLKPVATVTGYELGGDEYTASTPGHAVIELK